MYTVTVLIDALRFQKPQEDDRERGGDGRRKARTDGRRRSAQPVQQASGRWAMSIRPPSIHLCGFIPASRFYKDLQEEAMFSSLLSVFLSISDDPIVMIPVVERSVGSSAVHVTALSFFVTLVPVFLLLLHWDERHLPWSWRPADEQTFYQCWSPDLILYTDVFLYVKWCEAWVLVCKLLSDVLVFVRVIFKKKKFFFLLSSLFLKRKIITWQRSLFVCLRVFFFFFYITLVVCVKSTDWTPSLSSSWKIFMDPMFNCIFFILVFISVIYAVCIF